MNQLPYQPFYADSPPSTNNTLCHQTPKKELFIPAQCIITREQAMAFFNLVPKEELENAYLEIKETAILRGD